MKMKMKRILASIFACVVSLTAFASCKDADISTALAAVFTVHFLPTTAPEAPPRPERRSHA